MVSLVSFFGGRASSMADDDDALFLGGRRALKNQTNIKLNLENNCMLSKLRAFGHFPIQKLNARGLRKLLVNPLCTVIESSPEAIESPELPSWAKLGAASETEDDDFVIPSLANWVESHKLGSQFKAVKEVLKSEAEEESDADKISKVLRQNKYASPVDAAIALDRLGSELSPMGSIEKVLKRFSNDWVPALGAFEWAKTHKGYDHTPELYDSMVDILGKCKRFEAMWGLVEEMTSSKGLVSLNTMTKVMRRLAKARMFDEAIEAFRGVERFGVSKDVFALNALLDALNKENGGKHAVGVFLEHKESTTVPPNERTFNIMIHGSCLARRFDDARKTMEDMEKRGFLPDVFSYTCLVEAHVRDVDFRRVFAVQNEMREKGLRPSVVTYTIVMHGLGKAKQIDSALKVYEEVKETGLVPDAGFYNSVIFTLRKSGRLRDAREVFDDMTRQGVAPDVKTYTSMISCACEHSMEETALTLLKKMEESECEPDVDTYSPLLKMCCKKKRMKVLYFLLDHMFSNGVCVTAGTYSLLITGLCKSGKLEEACRFFEEMVSKGMVPPNHPYQRLKRELRAAEMVTGKPKKLYYKKFWPVNQGRHKGKN